MTYSALLPASLALMIGTGAAHAQFPFVKIADTDTLVPEGTGTFGLFNEPVIDGTNVVFEGFTGSGGQGLYFYDGSTLSKVIAAGDPAPGVTGHTFDNGVVDDEISIEGSTIAFEAFLDDGVSPDSREAVYTFSGGAFTLHALTGTTINPSTGTPFTFLDEPGLSGGKIAFRATSNALGGDVDGVYTNATGPLTTVADPGTAVPGFPTYSFVNADEDVTFNDDRIGIEYNISDGTNDDKILLLATTGGTLTPIANTIDTLSPNSGLVFDGLNMPVPDGVNYVFHGLDTNGLRGVYTNLGGPLRVVADQNTTAPGRADTFTSFDTDGYSIEGDRILFQASFAGGGGAYLEDNGTLLKILATGDTLDGKLVSGVSLGMESAISGDNVALQVSFDDGSAGIYMLTIPEPGSLALLALGVVAGLARRRDPAGRD